MAETQKHIPLDKAADFRANPDIKRVISNILKGYDTSASDKFDPKLGTKEEWKDNTLTLGEVEGIIAKLPKAVQDEFYKVANDTARAAAKEHNAGVEKKKSTPGYDPKAWSSMMDILVPEPETIDITNPKPKHGIHETAAQKARAAVLPDKHINIVLDLVLKHSATNGQITKEGLVASGFFSATEADKIFRYADSAKLTAQDKASAAATPAPKPLINPEQKAALDKTLGGLENTPYVGGAIASIRKGLAEVTLPSPTATADPTSTDSILAGIDISKLSPTDKLAFAKMMQDKEAAAQQKEIQEKQLADAQTARDREDDRRTAEKKEEEDKKKKEEEGKNSIGSIFSDIFGGNFFAGIFKLLKKIKDYAGKGLNAMGNGISAVWNEVTDFISPFTDMIGITTPKVENAVTNAPPAPPAPPPSPSSAPAPAVVPPDASVQAAPQPGAAPDKGAATVR